MALRETGCVPANRREPVRRWPAILALLVGVFLLTGGCGPAGSPGVPGAGPAATDAARGAPALEGDGSDLQPVITIDRVWQPQGPAPIQGGALDASGAVRAVAPHPDTANILYVGAVNGGIWKRDEAAAGGPTWVAQRMSPTEDLPSLSIGALAFDPTDTTRTRMIAGAGRFSDYTDVDTNAPLGGPRGFVYQKLAVGDTWTVLSPAILADANISAVAARGEMLMATSNAGAMGLFRRADAAAAWEQIANNGTSGLPLGATTDLVSDPRDNDLFYTAVLGSGVYVSFDAGVTWTNISDSEEEDTPKLDAEIRAAGDDDDCVLAVSETGRLFAAVLVNGQRQFVGYSGGDAIWVETALTELARPGQPGGAHVAIAATTNDSALIGSARALAFDRDGSVLQGDAGGIFKRDNNGDWSSLNAGLQIAEMHDIAYDELSMVLIAGLQDGGTAIQAAPGDMTWMQTLAGGAGDVKVDDKTLQGMNRSRRFFSGRNLANFQWRVYDAANPTTPVAGLGGLIPLPTGLVPQAVTPIELGVPDPNRVIVGASNGVYESLDLAGGAAFVRIPDDAGVVGAGPNGGEGDPIAYGVMGNPDLLYVGAGPEVYIRTSAAGMLERSQGYVAQSAVRGIVIDPFDRDRVYVCDNEAVRRTLDGGGAWEDITGDLGALTSRFHCIEYVSSGDGEDAIVVGTDTGVYARTISAAGVLVAGWVPLGVGLPRVPVWDLDYDFSADVLAAATLGRGAWKLQNIASPLGPITLSCPTTPIDQECTDRGSPGRWGGLLAGFSVTAPLLAEFPMDLLVGVDGATPTPVEDRFIKSPGMFLVPFDGALGHPAKLPFGLRTVEIIVRSGLDANRTQTCTVMVNVVDTTPPQIVCPDDITMDAASPTGTVVNFATPPAVDNCDLESTVVCIPQSGTEFPIGPNTVECMSTDSQGNTGMCTFTITIVGDDPVITCPDDVTAEAVSAAGAMVPFPDPTATGGTPPYTFDCTPASDTLFALGPTTVTCTVIDDAGKTDQCTFTVMVVDTTDPVVTCPDPITMTSAVPVTVTWEPPTVTDAVTANIVPECTPASGSTFQPDTVTTVTCTGTDDADNTGMCTFTITIRPPPTGDPVITCPPAPEPVEATSADGAVVTFPDPTATGGTPEYTFSCTPASGDTFPIATTPVTCTVTDATGKMDTCTFDVIVRDTTPPEIDCPDDIVVTSSVPVAVEYDPPTVTDAVTANIVPVCDPASGSTFPVGTTTVACTATDDADNTGTCTFTVTVAPFTIRCPPDQNAVAGPTGTAVVTWPDPTTMGGVGAVNIVCEPESGSSFTVGTHPVTCTATDAEGNKAECTFTVTVTEDADCTDLSTCEGELHEVTLQTECLAGALPGLNKLSARFLDGNTHDSEVIDELAVEWTGDFPEEPQTGLNDVLTIEDVTVENGCAKILLRITAREDSFGTGFKRIDVVLNGRLNAGIAHLVGEEVRAGTHFSWNERCGNRPECDETMTLDCPERFMPRFFTVDNVGLTEWLDCR